MSPVTGYLSREAQSAGVPDRRQDAHRKDEADKKQTPVQSGPSAVQMELFENKLLDEKNVKQHKLIGQLFDTYWLVEFGEKLFIIDQHAAHEKVLYERFMEQFRTKQQTSQMITPPVIVTLTLQEEAALGQYRELFEQTGFEIEHFGGHDYSISAVPDNLYGISDQTLFTEILDGLTDISEKASLQAHSGKDRFYVLQSCGQGEQQAFRTGGGRPDRGASDSGKSVQLPAWQADDHSDDKVRTGKEV